MVYEIIIKIFIVLSFFIVLNCINTIADYFKEKKNHQFMLNQEEYNTNSKLDLMDRTNLTIKLMELINTLIDNEISKTLQSCIRLGSKYESTRLDKDAELISKAVFESIKSEIFLEKDLILTEEFLMQHIADEVLIRLIKYTQEYNNKRLYKL